MVRFLVLIFYYCISESQSQKIITIIDNQISAGKRVISIGEMHQYQPIYTLLNDVFKSEITQRNIDLIIVEFGNSLYQDILDRYISGQNVPMDSVRLVWRNTLISPNTIWDSPVYETFFKTIREINLKLDEKLKYRVIASVVNIDWNHIQTRDDMRPYYQVSRSETMFNSIRKEVYRKNKRAILIAGGVHTSRVSVQNTSRNGYSYNDVSVGALLEFYYPNTNFIIQNSKTLSNLNIAELAHLKPGTVLLTSDPSLRDVPVNDVTTMKNFDGTPFKGYLDYTLDDMADAVIYWGEIQDSDFIDPNPETYLDDSYWKELNRRSLILRNQPMDEGLRVGE